MARATRGPRQVEPATTSESFAGNTPSGIPQPVRLVLDTNVVLDCCVFRDPAVQDLMVAIETGRVQVLVHEHALEELERVLAYPQCRLNVAAQRQVLDRYRAVAMPAPMPHGFGRDTPLLPVGFPRCRDRDDEPFLALAYHARADGIVTRDEAVLELRKKARRFGVAILRPTDLASLYENAATNG